MYSTGYLASEDKQLIVGFDLEWTKNYRIKNGNRPFCFSFVYLCSRLDISQVKGNMPFGFLAGYSEHEREIGELIYTADQTMGEFLKKGHIIVGHQLPADIGVITGNSCHLQLNNFPLLKERWRNRRESWTDGGTRVFDTRYDLGPFLCGRSRRLVDVCNECLLDVRQPELQGSMTAMQKTFYDSQDSAIMEKLSVLNIRHSLSAALLYYFYAHKRKPRHWINVNRILHANLKTYYDYVNSVQFRKLLS